MRPTPNQNFIDCTFGGGGHALAILEKIRPNGRLLGIDWDESAVKDSRHQNLILANDNYCYLKKIAARIGLKNISGILIDLGFSSDQLLGEGRGFSFMGDDFLDLRYNRRDTQSTAADILRQASENELFEIFKNYGDEPLARPIAKTIVAARSSGQRMETADMLVQLVSGVYRRHFRHRSRRHPAARVFQALRIAVNDEWGNLKAFLPAAVDLLAGGGRLAVISFHSGEDRIVKNFFRQCVKLGSPAIEILTKKPITASVSEQHANARSRSAKLRVIAKK